MAYDSGTYDITQFRFDDASQERVDRAHRRLCSVFAQTSIPRDHLYYIVASALECLTHRRSDYIDALSRGTPAASCAEGAYIGRVDAHFYFTVARRWRNARQRRIGPVSTSDFRLAG